MFKSYFRAAYRSVTKSKFSFINIGGLAIGMAVAILISLWIYDELSFNKNHRNYEKIVQVLQHQHISNGIQTFEWLPLPLAKVLRNTHGQDLKYVATTVRERQFITYNDKVLSREGLFAEPQFPNIISLEMIAGDPASIEDPASLLISESLAKTLFGSETPLNKQVKINNQSSFLITGVYKDIPPNSSFNDLGFIAPMATLIKDRPAEDNWRSSFGQTYALLTGNADAAKVSASIKNLLFENSGDASKPELFLNPIKNWHLYEYRNGELVAGRAQFVWLFGIIDALVLLLACVNFMNLSTARSAKKAREVGIRKTLGSLRVQLIGQFFYECLLTVVFAATIAIILVSVTIDLFGGIAGKQLSIPFGNPVFWAMILAFILLTTILSGSYPALYLSSFKPVKVLKGMFHAGPNAGIARKVLVVFQFTVSVTLIIGTIQVYRQVQYAKNRPIGYDRDRLLTITMNNPEIVNNYEPFRNDLLNAGLVEGVSRSSSSTTNVYSFANNLDWKGKDPNIQATFGTILVDPAYGDLVKWKITEGRNFSGELTTDSSGFLFNETAIRLMGLRNPVGETVKWHGKEWRILGVVKDMVMTSPFDKSLPTVFLMDNKERDFSIINVKLKTTKAAAASLKEIETIFKKYCSSSPFEYKFTDDAYAAKFAAEERIGKLSALFSTLAILISCLGLFGLASYVAEQRSKEISVRKILGASSINLWALLSKDFVWLVLISSLIAAPVSAYMLNKWLQNYDYRAVLSWWVFVAGIGAAILITLFTVSYQSIKVAIANPIKALRSE
jgi:putative ABC transport system permease protein